MSTAITPDPAPHAVAQTFARIHTWIDEVTQPQRRLGKFIILAIGLHAAACAFILIDNTRPEIQPHIHTEVTLDDGMTSAAQSPAEAYWDKLTDPRLYVLPQPTAPASATALTGPTVPFGPDIAAAEPVPMPSPAEITSFPFLNQPLPTLNERVEAALVPARQPFTYQENPAPLAKATTWQWGSTLAARGPAGVTALPSPVSDTDIDPTRLRVAVAPDGAVSDVILDQTSQKPELDQQAILAVQKVRFQPTGQPGLAWGTVTIAWYYTPTPKEVAPPAAPLAP